MSNLMEQLLLHRIMRGCEDSYDSQRDAIFEKLRVGKPLTGEEQFQVQLAMLAWKPPGQRGKSLEQADRRYSKDKEIANRMQALIDQGETVNSASEILDGDPYSARYFRGRFTEWCKTREPVPPEQGKGWRPKSEHKS